MAARFVSTLLKTIEAAGPKQKFDGKQLAAYLKNKGVKQQEIEYFERRMGQPFAESTNLGALTTDGWKKLLEPLQLPIEISRMGGRFNPALIDDERVASKLEGISANIAEDLARYGKASLWDGGWLVGSPTGALTRAETYGEAADLVRKNFGDTDVKVFNQFSDGRYAEDAYLGALTENPEQYLGEDIRDRARRLIERDEQTAKRQQTRFGEYTTEHGDSNSYEEIVFRAPEATTPDREWKGHHHFPSAGPGYLAHMRTNERPFSNSLFIEEIQSDLHQGRKAGDYRPMPGVEDKSVEFRDRLSALMRQMQEANSAYYNARGGSAEEAAALARQRELSEQVGALDREARDAGFANYRDNMDAPAAETPWRTNWIEKAFQQAITDASERGLGAVEWTPGYVQSMRWTLDNQQGYSNIYDKEITQAARKLQRQYGGEITEPSRTFNDVNRTDLPDESDARDEALRELADDEPSAEDFRIEGVDENGEPTDDYEFDQDAYDEAMERWSARVDQREREILDEIEEAKYVTEDDRWRFEITPALAERAKQGWPTWALAPGAIGLGALASDDAEAAFSTRIPKTIPMGEASALMDARRDAAKALQEGDSITDVIDRTGWQPDMRIGSSGLVLPRDAVEQKVRSTTHLDDVMPMLGREIPSWNGTIDWSKLGAPQLSSFDDVVAIGANPVGRSMAGGALLGEFADLPDLFRFDPEYRALPVLPDDRDGFIGSAGWRTFDAMAGNVTPSRAALGIDTRFDQSPLAQQLSPVTGLFSQRNTLLSHEIPHVEREASISASDDPMLLSARFGEENFGYWKMPHEVGSRASELRGRDAPGGPLEPYIDTIERVRQAYQQNAIVPGNEASTYRHAGYFLPKGITRRAGAGAGVASLPLLSGEQAEAAALREAAEGDEAATAEAATAASAAAATPYGGLLYSSPSDLLQGARAALSGVAGAAVGFVPDFVTGVGEELSRATRAREQMDAYLAGTADSPLARPSEIPELPVVTDEAIEALGVDPSDPNALVGSLIAPLTPLAAGKRATWAAREGLAMLRNRRPPLSASPTELSVTSEFVPGSETGHMLDAKGEPLLAAPWRDRYAYSLTMEPPVAGSVDPIYAALGYGQMPALRGLGNYTGPSGKPERNPLIVSRVETPAGPLTEEVREDANFAEYLRGALTAQNASAAHKILPSTWGNADAVAVQTSLPGYAYPDMMESARLSADRAGVPWVDRGDGRLTLAPGFADKPLKTPKLSAVRGVLSADAWPQIRGEAGKIDSVYASLPWGPEGSGQVTQGLLSQIAAAKDPSRFWKAIEDPAVAERAGQLAQGDKRFGAASGRTPRKDIQRLRWLIANGALRQYVQKFGTKGLPAGAGIGLGLGALREEDAESI